MLCWLRSEPHITLHTASNVNLPLAHPFAAGTFWHRSVPRLGRQFPGTPRVASRSCAACRSPVYRPCTVCWPPCRWITFRLACSSLAAGNAQLHLRLGAQGCCALLFCQNSLSFALLPLVTQKLLIELLDTPLNISSARGPQLHGHRLLLACLLKLDPVALGTNSSRELAEPSLFS